MANNFAMVHNLILHKVEKKDLNFESKEALKCVLQEYEIHAKLIQEELDKCKKDHVYLQGEITRLVEENKLLYERQMLSSKDSPKGETLPPSDESELVDNLKHQLSLALQENDALNKLWKSSLGELDSLKEKLTDYQSGKQLTLTQYKLNNAQQDYTEAIRILESQITFLKEENYQLSTRSQSLESQLAQATSHLSIMTEKGQSLKNSLDKITAEEQDWKSRYIALESDYIQMNRDYLADKVKFARVYEYEKADSHLKEKLDSALKQRNELQSALERCQDRIDGLLNQETDNRMKVQEALSLVEEAMDDREKALMRDAASAGEVEKMKEELDSLVKEAGERVAAEVCAVRKQFEHQISALKHQLSITEQERDRKIKEADQWQTEYERRQSLKDTPEEISDRRDKQLERLNHELHFTEAQCVQLGRENDALHTTISQIQDRCRKNSKEKVKLKCDLKSTVDMCHQWQEQLALMAERADLLTSQLNQTELQLSQLQNEVLFHRENCTNIRSKSSLANTIELYKYFDDSYGQMNNKWKNEMSALTEKFEAKLKKIKAKKTNSNKEASHNYL